MSSAIWSLRLRPVCSLAPAAPAISVTRRSIAVWMSSSLGANTNESLGELLFDAVERGDDDAALVVGQQADARQHLHVRARTDEVVAREPAVERQADREREQLVGRALAEPAVPERLAARRLVRRARSRGARALAARPRLGREAPEAHEALGVLVAERVVGVVGREVVVVEPRGARRPTASQRPGSSRSRTSPVTCSCVASTNAASARISGACHMPS